MKITDGLLKHIPRQQGTNYVSKEKNQLKRFSDSKHLLFQNEPSDCNNKFCRQNQTDTIYHSLVQYN